MHYAILLAGLWFGVAAPAAPLTGEVVWIADGDTLTMRIDGRRVKIRLGEIDTPERDQPYGFEAARALFAMAFGKTASVDVQDIASDGRTVGRVYIGSIDTSAELVRQGYAWVYRHYARDPALLVLETEARARKLGLWAAPDPVPPWDWRHRRLGPSAARAADADHGPARFQCGTKKYCREMRSCTEAQYHLETCGLTRLDGDKDGVACNTLCR